MINVHTHSFNARYIPDQFLGPYIGKAPSWVIKIVAKLFANGASAAVLTKLIGNVPNLKKYQSFLKVGIKKSQDEILEEMITFYPPTTRFVMLSLNFDHMGAGTCKIPYRQQMDDLIEVKRRYPNQCLPFVFADPRDGDADYLKEIIAEYMNKGCAGIKLYPALGYFPFDPRLEKVYAFAEAHQIPIMTHCSRGGTFYLGDDQINFLNPQSFNPQSDKTYKYAQNGDKDDFADIFLDPDNYTDVLTKYPNLKICFAHYGFDAKIKGDNTVNNDWYIKINNLIEKYPNVYTDISYSLYNDKLLDIFKNNLINGSEKLRKRILFGTDFFMTLGEGMSEVDLYHNTLKKLGSDLFEEIASVNNISYLTSEYYDANVPTSAIV